MNSNKKTALVLGAGGFIGHHMVTKLKSEGYWVRGVDLKNPEYETTLADEFVIFDLRKFVGFNQIMTAPVNSTFDEIYQFAADMGGADFVFTGEHDADIMHNSASINLNVLETQKLLNEAFHVNSTKVFYSSSACVYPAHNQLEPGNPNCEEDSAYPADPDSDYGWEKLFSERLFLAFNRNYKIPVAIARFHNIFGPKGTWDGGREKSPAAMCRKVAQAVSGGEIIVYGDGEQTRSFLLVDECVEGVRRLMQSDFTGPVNIGSDEMISINNLVNMVAGIAGKEIKISHDLQNKALGVRGRNSDNRLIAEKLGWVPSLPLSHGMSVTYDWILEQVNKNKQ